MVRTGSAPDNTLSESLVTTLKAELVSRAQCPSWEAAGVAIFDYPEDSCKRTRIHSSLGYKSPADFEKDRMREAPAA
jgi:transposase InsO family protein